MIVTNIYNIIPLISFGFIEYDEDVVPPIEYIYIYMVNHQLPQRYS